jgi:positive regulator of sigma E activity
MKGKIYSMEGSSVFIAGERTDCFGCVKCHGKPKLIAVENRMGLDLSLGQIVETAITKKSLLKQIFSALLPPFLGFTAGFLLIRHIFPTPEDAAQAAAGAAGLFAAGFITYLVRKRLPVKDLPTVVRIL